jgi:hypothetical protein
MMLNLEQFKADIVNNIKKKLTEIDHVQLGAWVDNMKEHEDYSEETAQQLLSYAISMWVVILCRQEDQRRMIN